MVIRKIKGGKYRLYSKKKKRNLGTFNTKAQAIIHEKQVAYFKSLNK